MACLGDAIFAQARGRSGCAERDFFLDNLALGEMRERGFFWGEGGVV